MAGSEISINNLTALNNFKQKLQRFNTDCAIELRFDNTVKIEMAPAKYSPGTHEQFYAERLRRVIDIAIAEIICAVDKAIRDEIKLLAKDVREAEDK